MAMKMLTSVLLLTLMLFAPQIGAASDDVGQWKTWVIRSPDQYRVAPPPDAAATAAEIKTLKETAAQRTPAALDTIASWTIVGPSYRWSEIAVGEALQRGLGSPI